MVGHVDDMVCLWSVVYHSYASDATPFPSLLFLLLPHLFLLPSLPSLPLLRFPSYTLPGEARPLSAAKRSGDERLSSSSGSGRSPAARRISVNFRLKKRFW